MFRIGIQTCIVYNRATATPDRRMNFKKCQHTPKAYVDRFRQRCGAEGGASVAEF